MGLQLLLTIIHLYLQITVELSVQLAQLMRLRGRGLLAFSAPLGVGRAISDHASIMLGLGRRSTFVQPLVGRR